MRQRTALLVISAIALAFFWQCFVSEKILLGNDGLEWFFGIKCLQASAIRDARLPLWNNFSYSGTPLLANSQAAFFYPTNILLLAIQPEHAIWILQLANMIVAGSTMFLFARKIGLGNSPSLVSAISFMASSQLVARVFAGHLTLVSAYSLIPLVFLGIENAARKKTFSSFALVGIALALQFFAGFMQVFYYTVLFATAFGLFRLWQQKPVLKKTSIAKGIALMAIIFFCITAVQLFPSIELAKNMSRTGGLENNYGGSFSAPLSSIAQAVFPDIFGNPANHTFWGEVYYWEFVPFIGTASLLLAALAAIFCRKNSLVLFFFGAAVLTFLLALGQNTPLFAFSKYFLSAFGIFRAPARLLAIYTFAACVLAGFGAQAIIEAKPETKKKALIACAAIAIVFFAIFSAFALSESLIKQGAADFIQKKFSTESAERLAYLKSRIGDAISLLGKNILSAALSGSLLFIAVFLSTKKNAVQKAAFLVVLAVFLELFFYSRLFLEPQTEKSVFEKNQQIVFLEEKSKDSIFRVASQQGALPQYLSIKYGIESASGYDPTILKNYAELASVIEKKSDFFSDIYFLGGKTNLKLLGLLNVKYLVTEKGISENSFALPRAFVSGKAIVVPEGKALAELSMDSFNPKETVVLEGFGGNAGSNGFFVPAKAINESREKIFVETETEKNGFLVLSVPYYPGWKVSIDGVPTKIFKADHAIMATELPSGKHSIVFSFEPENVAAGVFVSAAALLALFLFFFYKISSKIIESKRENKKTVVKKWKKPGKTAK